MATRSSHNWKNLPGNFYKLNTFQVFSSSNRYGIPDLGKTEGYPDGLIPYNHRVRSELGYKNLGIHFFLDDYRFESVWQYPDKTLERVAKADFVLTPDFSLYTDWPLSLQIYNTYRNRWLGAFWQDKGVNVIPTIAWSTEQSYEFCFLGIQKRSVVAISTQGIRTEEEKELFKSGYEEMINQISPEIVLCYGKMLEIETMTPVKEYSTLSKTLRELRHGR